MIWFGLFLLLAGFVALCLYDSPHQQGLTPEEAGEPLPIGGWRDSDPLDDPRFWATRDLENGAVELGFRMDTNADFTAIGYAYSEKGLLQLREQHKQKVGELGWRD